MSAVQYPFIDIAVHKDVRDHFVRGEALALFSLDLKHVLWANGRGAALLGNELIYDLLDRGPNSHDVTYRQIASAASRLHNIGDKQGFTIRINSGFRSNAVVANVKVIEPEAGKPAILFSSAIDITPPSEQDCAERMIEGFDDPDIHMAVVSNDGRIIAASPHFLRLGIAEQTKRALLSYGTNRPGHLVKRPLATSKGYLPAAAGVVQNDPDLYLLFVVETVIGQLDPASNYDQSAQPEAQSSLSAVPLIQQNEETTALLDHNDDTATVTINPDVIVDLKEDDLPQEPINLPTEITDVDVIIEQTELLFDDNINQLPSDDIIDLIEEPSLALSSVEMSIEDETKVDLALSTDTSNDFAFNPAARASRFVWKIDAEGRFSSVSPEFANAVGKSANQIIGLHFNEINTVFNLDQDGKIIEALQRRDTWSGKTVYWPIENTNYMVPIDLAALPTYTRNRDFDGFRGFGIIRPADAIEDPSAMGLMLDEVYSALKPSSSASSLPSYIEDVPEAPLNVISEIEDISSESDNLNAMNDVQSIADETHGSGTGLFQGFAPEAQPISSENDRSNYRNNRPLMEHEGLSKSEQAAFQEIARKLMPEQKPAAPLDALFAEENTEAVDKTARTPSTNTIKTVIAPTPTPAPANDIVPVIPAEVETEITAIELVEELEAPLPEKTRATANLSEDIVDQMPIALLIQVENKLVHANPEFLRLTGYESIRELIDLGGLDALLQRDDIEQVNNNPGGMFAVRADDELVPVKAKLQSIQWDGDRALMLSLLPVETVSHISSVIDNVASQVANTNTMPTMLEEEVEELRSILETATDGVVLLTEDGSIRSLNKSASALFNFDNNEVSGRPFVNLFAHESQRAVLDYLSGLANNGVASVLNDGREVIGREAAGGFIPLFMTIGRLKASNGYCAVIRDITQWKRTEDELRNAKRTAETANNHKTDFLARVSHEIRTPLNAIIGFSDIMATERFGPVGHPRYVEYANDIGRSGRHVLDIVNDLLDISKIEAGQMEVDFTAVPLNETISEAVSIVQPQANNQRVIIRTSLSESVPQIVADLRSIKQIVLNVLSNAIRFTPSGGQIVVSTSYESNGSVMLRIRDTGIGMTRSELDQAMKPFRQVAASHKRVRGDGTGLGLPLTKAMVDANRADFSISSTPNEGTLIEISFPSQRVLAN